MHPAFSVIFFTTLAGAAQGLVVALAVAQLAGVESPRAFTLSALTVSLVLLLAGLVSSTFHLGGRSEAGGRWRCGAPRGCRAR